jgi:hypothetical protein
VLMVALTVTNVAIDDLREFFRFWRQALVSALFYLEQQSTTELNCRGLIRGLQGSSSVIVRWKTDAGVVGAGALENC